jgi:hypothetical protein
MQVFDNDLNTLKRILQLGMLTYLSNKSKSQGNNYKKIVNLKFTNN